MISSQITGEFSVITPLNLFSMNLQTINYLYELGFELICLQSNLLSWDPMALNIIWNSALIYVLDNFKFSLLISFIVSCIFYKKSS